MQYNSIQYISTFWFDTCWFDFWEEAKCHYAKVGPVRDAGWIADRRRIAASPL
jgi:hypothetical protein